jgi:hypothetical protein
MAPLVLTARALGIATGATAFACALYFWARLAHVVIYTLGILLAAKISDEFEDRQHQQRLRDEAGREGQCAEHWYGKRPDFPRR